MRLLVLLCVVAVLGGAQAGLQETWQELLESLKGLGQHAADKLKEIAQTLSNAGLDKLIDSLQKDKDTKRAINFEQLKEDLKQKFGEKYAEIEALLKPYGDKIKTVLEKYGIILKGLIEKIKNTDSVEKVKEIIEKIKGLTGLTKRSIELTSRNAITTTIQSYLEKLKELFEKIFKDKLVADRLRRDLGSKITDFFKPHINKINDLVQQIGTTTTDHAKNLWQNLQDSAADLKGKLSAHVDQLKEHGQTLVGHGKDAVNALQQSVTDILNSTFQNMVGTLKDAIDTGKDAIDTVGEHVSGAVN